MLNNKLVAFTEIKQLENNLYNHCFKKCLKLDDNIFSDEERECLSNCNGKILRLFEISHHDFSSIEQNIHILSKGLQGKDLWTLSLSFTTFFTSSHNPLSISSIIYFDWKSFIFIFSTYLWRIILNIPFFSCLYENILKYLKISIIFLFFILF